MVKIQTEPTSTPVPPKLQIGEPPAAKESWDWVFSDGSRVQVDKDLSHAVVALPDSMMTMLGSTYLEFGRQRIAEYLEKNRDIPKAKAASAYTFLRADSSGHGLNRYYYRSDGNIAAPTALLPPEPAVTPAQASLTPPAQPQAPLPLQPGATSMPITATVAAPATAAPKPAPVAAKKPPALPPVRRQPPQQALKAASAQSIQQIGNSIAKMTMRELDQLCTYLHDIGIKAVFATFGQNSIPSSTPPAPQPSPYDYNYNEYDYDDHGYDDGGYAKAEEPVLHAPPAFDTGLVAAQVADQPAPKKKRSNVTDKRSVLSEADMLVLPEISGDEESIWRSVYKRPISHLDILEDLGK